MIDDREWQALQERIVTNAQRNRRQAAAAPARPAVATPVPRVGDGPRISRAQVQAAMAKWELFWGAPKHVAACGDPAAWMDLYVEAVNKLPLVRRYWDDVSVRILSASRWFPYPNDLQDVAQKIYEGRSSW